MNRVSALFCKLKALSHCFKTRRVFGLQNAAFRNLFFTKSPVNCITDSFYPCHTFNYGQTHISIPEQAKP